MALHTYVDGPWDEWGAPSTKGGRLEFELFWVNHYTWLEERGYRLRPRYKPDWSPSWWATGTSADWAEDNRLPLNSWVLDATRISDGKIVGIKRLWLNRNSETERKLIRFVNSEPLISDPRNHSVPFIEIFENVPFPAEDDNPECLLVMPYLRPYDSPRMETVGEAVSLFIQIFEGLQLLHEHGVAHRDCTWQNIMMDDTPLYPRPHHPIEPDRGLDWKKNSSHLTRTQRPVRYYLVDFGLSRHYEQGQARLEIPLAGGDKTVPEHWDGPVGGVRKYVPCDPFPTDVYYAGNFVREEFMARFYGLDFMKPLIDDMVQVDPADRPTMDEVMRRFKGIYSSLSWWKLRARLVGRREFWTFPHRTARYIGNTVRNIVTLKSALPLPPA